MKVRCTRFVDVQPMVLEPVGYGAVTMLLARGVDVTLFATLDSQTSATLDGVCATGYAEDPSMDGRVWEALHVAHALARSGEFDLVHNHLDWLPLAFARHVKAPLVTTIHGFSGRGILPAYVNARSSSSVAISDADRAPELEYVPPQRFWTSRSTPITPRPSVTFAAFTIGGSTADLEMRRPTEDSNL